MDQRRIKLQQELEGILGTRNVYFQPPASKQLVYPCIKYSRDTVDAYFADDRTYRAVPRYEITVIDKDPDSQIYKEILEHFNKIVYNRSFRYDNLNHDVLLLYY